MIDREKVITHFNDAIEASGNNNKWRFVRVDVIKDALELLKEQEIVVRCKDCKHSTLTFNGDCKYCDLCTDDNGFLVERNTSGDWYCADGERR